MKRFVLLIVMLFSLLGYVGCMNKNEISNSEVDKTTSDPSKILTEDKSMEKSNDNKEEDRQSETINKIDFQDISEFIPHGWHILQKYDDDSLAIAEGDLNKDGLTDKAFVIEESIKGEGSTEYAVNSPRHLLIVFANNDNTYSLSIKAEKAILLGCEGGPYGDPFDGISISRGSVLLNFFGGSYPRWYSSYQFRYQNNGWYLIGATEGGLVEVGEEMDNVEEDYNLLTGDYIFRELVDGKIKTRKGNRGKKQLINLQEFDPDEAKSQF